MPFKAFFLRDPPVTNLNLSASKFEDTLAILESRSITEFFGALAPEIPQKLTSPLKRSAFDLPIDLQNFQNQPSTSKNFQMQNEKILETFENPNEKEKNFENSEENFEKSEKATESFFKRKMFEIQREKQKKAEEEKRLKDEEKSSKSEKTKEKMEKNLAIKRRRSKTPDLFESDSEEIPGEFVDGISEEIPELEFEESKRCKRMKRSNDQNGPNCRQNGPNGQNEPRLENQIEFVPKTENEIDPTIWRDLPAEIQWELKQYYRTSKTSSNSSNSVPPALNLQKIGPKTKTENSTKNCVKKLENQKNAIKMDPIMRYFPKKF